MGSTPEQNRKYYKKNRKKILARNKTWEENNKEKAYSKRREWAEQNRDKVREYHRNYRLQNPERIILSACKTRAKKKGLKFDLTKEDIQIPEFCPILGIHLEIATGKLKDSSPSVDRIDPSKGYIKGNIQIISNKANRIKTDANWHEIRAVADYMEKLHK